MVVEENSGSFLPLHVLSNDDVTRSHVTNSSPAEWNKLISGLYEFDS